MENESRKVSASQKLLRRRYGGVRRGVSVGGGGVAVAVVRKQRVKKIDAFKKVFLSFFFFSSLALSLHLSCWLHLETRREISYFG